MWRDKNDELKARVAELDTVFTVRPVPFDQDIFNENMLLLVKEAEVDRKATIQALREIMHMLIRFDAKMDDRGLHTPISDALVADIIQQIVESAAAADRVRILEASVADPCGDPHKVVGQ